MSEIDKLVELSKHTQRLLVENPEWIKRYAEYAKLLLARQDAIKDKKKFFHQFSPLFLYMNIGNAKGRGIFGLRYAGQQVADLKISDSEVRISTKDYDANNERNFHCGMKLDNDIWSGAKASEFRKHFRTAPPRNNDGNNRNDEHRVESMLLTEFSKKKSSDKKLLDIQPVRLFGGISRFQMPTPLSASGTEVKYSSYSGGGIDILCRIGKGAKTRLCVMEVKDETLAKEPPIKAIGQAIAYAVFLRELLKSESGSDWYKIFGFSREVPKELEIVANIAMRFNEKIGSSFDGEKIQLGGGDKLVLHSIYFEETEQGLKFKQSGFLRENSCK